MRYQLAPDCQEVKRRSLDAADSLYNAADFLMNEIDQHL